MVFVDIENFLFYSILFLFNGFDRRWPINRAATIAAKPLLGSVASAYSGADPTHLGLSQAMHLNLTLGPNPNPNANPKILSKS
jgi:hypothetical protein